MELDRLEDYAARKNEHWPDMQAIIAFTSPGTHLPCVMTDSLYILPQDADFLLITDSPVMRVATAPSPVPAVPDWRVFDPANPLDLSAAKQFKAPSMLGGFTLSEGQAKALAGADPEIIREAIKTAGDLILYMMAAQYTSISGDIKFLEWSYNHSARRALKVGAGNCGATSNMANFLLEGDFYEEVGFMMYAGSPWTGGHVYNYIKHNGKYYIIDFLQYAGTHYSPGSEFPVMELDRLEDYAARKNEHWPDMQAIIAFTSPGTHLPCVMTDTHYLLPQGAEFLVIYESPVMRVGTAPCPVPSVPDWRKPQ
jgi:hypothetical protein